MKKTFLIGLSAGVFSLVVLGVAQATPVVNDTDMGIYHYVNSGMLVGIYDDNDNNLTFMEGEIESFLDVTDPDAFTLSKSSSTINLFGWNANTGALVDLGSSVDGKVDNLDALADDYYSGMWEVTPSTSAISFYTVKAGDYYSLYHVSQPDNTGSWSVQDIRDEYPHATNTNWAGNAISHYTGFNSAPAPVPEPATMLLFGTGLVGLVGSRLRKKKK